jgi:hypothetical protein
MDYPGYFSSHHPLLEGEWYTFTIHNRVVLQDGESYYVLYGPDMVKHFLPARPYEPYALTVGAEIRCRVDRINCTGRIFLEPEHPVYSEGEIYPFERISGTNSDRDSICLVQDFFENRIEVKLNPDTELPFLPGNTMYCRIRKIKKAIPELDYVRD